MSKDLIPQRFLGHAKTRGSAPAYYVRTSGGSWEPTSWSAYVDEARRVAKALIALGHETGGATTILGFNRPEWTTFYMGTMLSGGLPVGIYTTCSAPEVQYIVDHCEALAVLVENEAQWKKIAAERERLPKLVRVITMKGAASIDDELVQSWDEFLASGDDIPNADVDERVAAITADSLGTLIYTSGTTGPPKGVMLSHENLAWTAASANKIIDLGPEDSNLSYLPLSHIAEQIFTIHLPISVGSRVYFAESIEKLPANLGEVHPSIFFGVPRVWEKFHAKIAMRLEGATGLKARLAAWARGVASRVHAERNEGREPKGALATQYKLASRLVFSKLHAAMGLDKARVCVSGAAPLSPDVMDFLASLDIPIREVYGQSEDCGPTSFNVPGRTRFGTVGPAFPGVDIKIADDDEILVRGPNVFQGYYKDQDATDATLIDGWLHSGDLGRFDADGFLTIIGRKKEIIITAGGKNIAPKNIEAALKNLPMVNEAVVIGDRRRFLSALLTLDPEAAEAYASDNGIGLDDVPTHPALLAKLQQGIDDDVNSQFARVEYVRKFTVLPRNFTVDEGELTPSLKIKRRAVDANWSDAIEAMYA